MIGDVIALNPEYFITAQALVDLFVAKTSPAHQQRFVVLVGGESGSGKSVTAVCMKQLLDAINYPSLILHMDDYFKLPPQTNHQQRVQDLTWVGLNEVRLDLLQEHLNAFINGAKAINKPLVHYHENAIGSETLDLSPYTCLIVEGTYVLALDKVDFRVFMMHNYHQTYQQRLERGREAPDPFIEQVLEIEHRIIFPMNAKADALVQEDYCVLSN